MHLIFGFTATDPYVSWFFFENVQKIHFVQAANNPAFVVCNTKYIYTYVHMYLWLLFIIIFVIILLTHNLRRSWLHDTRLSICSTKWSLCVCVAVGFSVFDLNLQLERWTRWEVKKKKMNMNDPTTRCV